VPFQKHMNTESPNGQKTGRQPRPTGDATGRALQDVIELERERGDVNAGAEPEQKSEIQKPRETD